MTSPTPSPNSPSWVQAPDGSWHQAAAPIPAPKPPAKSMSELGKGLVALSMCLVLGLVVVLIGAASSGTKTTPTTAAAASPVSSTETLAEWGTRTQHYVSDVQAATGDISSAASSYNTTRMIAGCIDLRTATVAWKAALPSPDINFDALLMPALVNYEKAADLCISGGKTLDADDLRKSGDAIEQATTSIKAATAYFTSHT